MKKETYENMIRSIQSSGILKNIVLICDGVFTKLAYLAYPVLLIVLAAGRSGELVRAVAVPGISFILLSIFRYLYNAPRPYEVFGISPVIKKDTKGKSMPSRHVFSIFVIAATVYYFCHPAGIALAAAGIVLAAARVAGGVHFPADVITGAVLGAACGLTGFYLI